MENILDIMSVFGDKEVSIKIVNSNKIEFSKADTFTVIFEYFDFLNVKHSTRYMLSKELMGDLIAFGLVLKEWSLDFNALIEKTP